MPEGMWGYPVQSNNIVIKSESLSVSIKVRLFEKENFFIFNCNRFFGLIELTKTNRNE